MQFLYSKLKLNWTCFLRRTIIVYFCEQILPTQVLKITWLSPSFNMGLSCYCSSLLDRLYLPLSGYTSCQVKSFRIRNWLLWNFFHKEHKTFEKISSWVENLKFTIAIWKIPMKIICFLWILEVYEFYKNYLLIPILYNMWSYHENFMVTNFWNHNVRILDFAFLSKIYLFLTSQTNFTDHVLNIFGPATSTIFRNEAFSTQYHMPKKLHYLFSFFRNMRRNKLKTINQNSLKSLNSLKEM